MKRALISAGVVILLALNAYGWFLLWDREDVVAEITAEQVSDALRDVGFMEGEAARDEEIGTLSAELQALREEIEKAGARPLAESNITSETGTVSVPVSDHSSGDGGLGLGKTALEFDVKARYSGLIAANDRGGIFTKGSFWVTLDGPGWSRVKKLPADSENSDFRVGSTLSAALSYYADRPAKLSFSPRRPRHWRFGLVAGGGLCLDPRDYAATLCLFAGYGVQF